MIFICLKITTYCFLDFEWLFPFHIFWLESVKSYFLFLFHIPLFIIRNCIKSDVLESTCVFSITFVIHLWKILFYMSLENPMFIESVFDFHFRCLWKIRSCQSQFYFLDSFYWDSYFTCLCKIRHCQGQFCYCAFLAKSQELSVE